MPQRLSGLPLATLLWLFFTRFALAAGEVHAFASRKMLLSASSSGQQF